MAPYSYTALNENGNEVKGSVDAESAAAAENHVADMGYIPMKVAVVKRGTSDSWLESLLVRLQSVKARDLILFTQQFKTMLQAGISMIPMLQILEEQTENKALKKASRRIADDIKAGETLYTAFSSHKNIFSDLYLNLMNAGEISGSLPEVLERLIYITEHEHKIKSDIKSALQYPVMVLIFLVAAFFILLIFVIPKFIRIFENAGIALPLPTKICIVMYNIMHDHWFLLMAGTIGLITGFFYYLKTSQGRFVFDSVCMRIPVIGPLLVKSAMSRFASIFSILQSSGIGVLESMEILTGAINNAAINREFEKISSQLQEGRGISSPLRNANHFTPLVINMVAIGEESGDLDEMLNQVASHYDSEVEYSMKALSDAIGPILTIGLAVVVGFFALAIFLPMWDLTKMVG